MKISQQSRQLLDEFAAWLSAQTEIDVFTTDEAVDKFLEARETGLTLFGGESIFFVDDVGDVAVLGRDGWYWARVGGHHRGHPYQMVTIPNDLAEEIIAHTDLTGSIR